MDKYAATDLEYQASIIPEKVIEGSKKNATKIQSRVGIKYPWAEILSEYVTGYVIPDPRTGAKVHIYPTLDDLANKYGCSPGYLKSKSGKESWSKRREFFQLKLQEQTAANRFHSVLSESSSSDARTLLAIDKLYALVEAYFEQYENMELCDDGKYRLKNQTYSEDPEAGVKEIKVQDLKGLVEVLDKAQALVRRTVGEPVNHNQHQDLLKSEIFNPMASTDAKSGTNNVDAMITKRNNIKKSEEQVRKEIAELQEQLED
jgi:hypothetical protein